VIDGATDDNSAAHREAARTGAETTQDAERLVFFSDAVVAIAITLLALELPLPTGTTNSALWHGLWDAHLDYLAFLISFLVIWNHWSSHHRLFRAVSLGGWLVVWNMLWLLAIVVTPFATRVITGDGAFEARFTLYAAVQAFAGLCLLLVVREVDRGGLLGHENAAAMVRVGYLRAWTALLTFGLSIPLAWFTRWAFACWFVFPVVRTWTRRLEHDTGRAVGATRIGGDAPAAETSAAP
jgi:uncharacterized membrane protein